MGIADRRRHILISGTRRRRHNLSAREHKPACSECRWQNEVEGRDLDAPGRRMERNHARRAFFRRCAFYFRRWTRDGLPIRWPVVLEFLAVWYVSFFPACPRRRDGHCSWHKRETFCDPKRTARSPACKKLVADVSGGSAAHWASRREETMRPVRLFAPHSRALPNQIKQPWQGAAV